MKKLFSLGKSNKSEKEKTLPQTDEEEQQQEQQQQEQEQQKQEQQKQEQEKVIEVKEKEKNNSQDNINNDNNKLKNIYNLFNLEWSEQIIENQSENFLKKYGMRVSILPLKTKPRRLYTKKIQHNTQSVLCINGSIQLQDIVLKDAIPFQNLKEYLDGYESNLEWEIGILFHGSVGGSKQAPGGWHVGFTIGRDQWCFHPGYYEGASRLEARTTSQSGGFIIWSNENIGWKPDVEVMYPIKIFVAYHSNTAYLYLYKENSSIEQPSYIRSWKLTESIFDRIRCEIKSNSFRYHIDGSNQHKNCIGMFGDIKVEMCLRNLKYKEKSDEKIFMPLNKEHLQTILKARDQRNYACAHLFEQLNSISNDLLLFIFRWLSFRDRSYMAFVSKQFYKLKYSAGVPNHVDIHFDKMVNNVEQFRLYYSDIFILSPRIPGNIFITNQRLSLHGGSFYNDIIVGFPIVLDAKKLQHVKDSAEYHTRAVEVGICVEGAVGTNDIGIGGWHVGFTIGDVQWCFHPGYTTPPGASRLQKRGISYTYWDNESVGFVPECNVLHPIKVFINYDTLDSYLYLWNGNRTQSMGMDVEKELNNDDGKGKSIYSEMTSHRNREASIYKKKWTMHKDIFNRIKPEVLPSTIKYHTENDSCEAGCLGIFGPMSVYLAIKDNTKDEIIRL